MNTTQTTIESIKFLFLDPETPTPTLLGTMVCSPNEAVSAIDVIWSNLEESRDDSKLIAELVDGTGTTTETKHITEATLSRNIGQTLTEIITQKIIPAREFNPLLAS